MGESNCGQHMNSMAVVGLLQQYLQLKYSVTISTGKGKRMKTKINK
jgi:hypothetical protein